MKISFPRLTTLALCAVVCMGASAKATIGAGVLTINGSNDVQFNNLNEIGGGQVKKIKLVGDFRQGWTGYWLQNGSAQEKASITEIDMSEADMSGDNNVWSFVSFPNLKKVVWPVEGKITNIPSYAFKQTGIEELHVPGYIKFIRSQAIDDASNAKNLKAVYFDVLEGKDASVRMHIERQAFSNNYALADVFVMTEGVITADNNAFPHMDTYGHADPERKYATLHFPTSKVELYVNLKHALDEATASNRKLFQEWLVQHYIKAEQEHNGFYEFINYGELEIEEEPVGAPILKTFSHPTLAHLVPAGVKAYIVNSINPTADGKNIVLTLKSVNVIPAATGVILFGGSNAFNENGNPIIAMTPVTYNGEPFDMNNRNGNVNYLTATSNIGDHETFIKNIQADTIFGGQHVYYNFLLTKFSETETGRAYKQAFGNYGTGNGLPEGNWVSFFRAVEAGGFIAPGKAFLSLDASQFAFVSKGGEIVINVDKQLNPNDDEFYRMEYKDQNMNLMSEDEMKKAKLWYLSDGTKIEWEKSWGTRQIQNFTPAKAKTSNVVNDEDGIASSIAKKAQEDNNYYTLQGVKVANPEKGIYIHKGKKIVIK